MKSILRALALLALTPLSASAQGHLTVNTGVSLTFGQVFSNIISVAATAIVGLSITVFLYGAFQMTLFAAKEETAKGGKTIMIQALTGLAVVLMSYAIIRLVYYFLYS